MADKLANKAAVNAAWAGTFDYDLLNDYTQTFRDKYSLQQTIQVQIAEGPTENRACIRHLDDSLRKALHDKLKLGQSNQNSLYFQLWDMVQPFRVKPAVMRCGLCHKFQNHTRGMSSNIFLIYVFKYIS